MLHIYCGANDLSECELYTEQRGDGTFILTDNRDDGYGDIAESDSEDELQTYADRRSGNWM